MKILITGICGFVGSRLALALQERTAGLEIVGLDNFIRPGSETNRVELKDRGVQLVHGDIRMMSDLEGISGVNWVIDAAANPSVLAGIDGKTSSRQLVEHNLIGTINLLEFCKTQHAGFTLLSTSRVYSIPPLAELPVETFNGAFRPDLSKELPAGITEKGVNETFSTTAPVSLYGATKVASETMALEYGATFDFPVWVNRCGVLAGAGQFGRADQGIFAYWINCWLQRRSLRYIGFDGTGAQVRDAFHPRDLATLVELQIDIGKPEKPEAWNVGGGVENAMSLSQLSAWCEEKMGKHSVASDSTPRPFDIPWMVMDGSKALDALGWKPTVRIEEILDEILRHAERSPSWLDLSAPL